MFARTKASRFLAAVLCLIFSCVSVFPEEGPSWQVDLDYAVRFFETFSSDLLLVGTDRHTFALNPRDGQILWRSRNLNVEEADTLFVPERRLLVASEGWGGRFQDNETSLLALDAASGAVLWESEVILQRVLAVVPDSMGHRALIVSTTAPHGKERRQLLRSLQIHLCDLDSGRLLWSEVLGTETVLTPSPLLQIVDRERLRGFDLGAYHAPRFLEDDILLFYNGVESRRLSDGRLNWRIEGEVLVDGLQRSFPEPIIDDDTLYCGLAGRLLAIDLKSGKKRWESGDLGTPAAIHLDTERLYVQLGGRFWDPLREEWKAQGPFGAAVLGRRRGNLQWKWTKAQGSVTNLCIFGDRLYLADSRALIARDRFTGQPAYTQNHAFSDAPRYLGLNEHGLLVLAGDQNVGGFRYQEGRREWSFWIQPPGPGFWQRLAGGLLTASGALLALGSYVVALKRDLLPPIPSPVSRLLSRSRLIRMGKAGGLKLLEAGRERLQESKWARLDGHHHYFFTRLPEQPATAVIGINLNSGEADQFLTLPHPHSNFVVDESQRRAFQVAGSGIEAFELQRAQVPTLKTAASHQP